MKYKLIVVLLIMSLITFAQNNRHSLYESIYNSSQEQEYDDISNLLPFLRGIYQNLSAEGYHIEDLNGNLYYRLGNTSQGLSQDETANSLAIALQTTPKCLKEMCLWGVTDYIAQNGLEYNKEGVDYIHKVKEFFDNPYKSVKDILKDSNLIEINLYIPEDSELVQYTISRSLSDKDHKQCTSDPFEVYKDSLNSLAEELKEKLEKFQQKYRNERKFKQAAEYALEDLKNTRDFYLDAPSTINTDWDLDERPVKRRNSSRYPDYESKSYMAMFNDNKKIIYWPSNSMDCPDSNHSGSTISFYDPSGRKITVTTSLPSIQQWDQFMKRTSKDIGYKEVVNRVVTYTDLSTGIQTPSILKRSLPICWRAKSKITNNIVILPFGKLWSTTASSSDLIEGYEVSCRDIENLSINLSKVNIKKTDNAKSIGIISTNYEELLDWYKKSLNHLMLRVNAIFERQNKIESEKKQRQETIRNAPLPILLKTTADRIRNDKNLFDYAIIGNGQWYSVCALVNSNSTNLFNDFWKVLKSIEVDNGNLILTSTYCTVENHREIPHTKEYQISYPMEDQKYISDLLGDLRKAFEDNISQFIAETFIAKDGTYSLSSQHHSIILPDRLVNANRIGIEANSNKQYVVMPLLANANKPTKGSICFTTNIHYSRVNLNENYNKKGYKVKFSD